MDDNDIISMIVELYKCMTDEQRIKAIKIIVQIQNNYVTHETMK